MLFVPVMILIELRVVAIRKILTSVVLDLSSVTPYMRRSVT